MTKAIKSVTANTAPIATTEPGPVPLHGVHLCFFDAFINDSGGRDKFHGLTTAQVCDEFVKPLTDPSKSLCDHLIETSSPSVNRATHFISHSWQYIFLDVVDAVQAFFHDQQQSTPTEEEVIVWFDLFSLPQHQRQKIESEWLKTAFTSAISAMGNVLMVLSPWNQPVTLTRAWCVFELYACSATKSNFNVALPPGQWEEFKKSLLESGNILQTFANIKSEDAQASEKEDLEAIQQAVRESVGFGALDRAVFKVLFDWMVTVLRTQSRTAESKGDEVDAVRWDSVLGGLYSMQGMYGDAIPLLTATLEKSTRLLGKASPLTLSVLKTLAVTYEMQGEYTKAEPLLIEYLDRQTSIRGVAHIEDLDTIALLASVSINLGKYQVAEMLLQGCLQRCETEGYGNDNPTTLKYKCQLADSLRHQKKYSAAEPLYTSCLTHARHTTNTSLVLKSLHGLATIHMHQRRLNKAEPLCLEALERSIKSHGKDNVQTFSKAQNLVLCYYLQRRYDEAEGVCVEYLGRAERVLGGEHPFAVEIRGSLSNVRETREEKGQGSGCCTVL
ncbi:Kinesin light chain 3 [Rhizophlyctis rosea]|nr:Kinesin light chain 3 [Rhizophlyctis rosea]